MIALHPEPDVTFDCPACGVALSVDGWYMPGMRTLAELHCPDCHRQFYGDLPVGHGLLYPALLDVETGDVYNEFGGQWFADWLEESFAQRKDQQLPIKKSSNGDVDTPLVLNCLDGLYGHSLLKLLNAQYYLDNEPECDLVVIVPSNLEWLVPAGVAVVWSVDLPLSLGSEWNDWFAREIKSFCSQFETVRASVAFSHPHPEDYDIERFSGIEPFDNDSWFETKPRVTYIWRDDRLWAPTRSSQRYSRAAKGLIYEAGRKVDIHLGQREQRRNVEKLATELRSRFPSIEFTVAGIGKPGGFPQWITDLRTTSLNAETERDLCRQYSLSHVVVGVHGSNMLLPSAHAGSVIELVPPGRWENMTQDLLFTQQRSNRESIFTYRHVPALTPPATVASVVTTLLEHLPQYLLHMRREWTRHNSVDYHQMRHRWKGRDSSRY